MLQTSSAERVRKTRALAVGVAASNLARKNRFLTKMRAFIEGRCDPIEPVAKKAAQHLTQIIASLCSALITIGVRGRVHAHYVLG